MEDFSVSLLQTNKKKWVTSWKFTAHIDTDPTIVIQSRKGQITFFSLLWHMSSSSHEDTARTIEKKNC